MFDEYVELLEEVLSGTGWALYDPEMAPDCLLEAPCGRVLEMDAATCGCPESHVNPVRHLGLI